MIMTDFKGDRMDNPVFTLVGWSKRKDSMLGACTFTVKLDARFAEKARRLKFANEQRFEERIRALVDYKYARATFLDGTCFLRSMSVEGNCACLGMSGNLIDADWTDMDVICYDGHNVDSKAQAYDLLAIFNYWVETVDALSS
jgi:hypothetical protein